MCKHSCIRCVENLKKINNFAIFLDFYRFTTTRLGVVSLRFTPLQNLPDGKPALFRLFAAGRTPVPVSKTQISK